VHNNALPVLKWRFVPSSSFSSQTTSSSLAFKKRGVYGRRCWKLSLKQLHTRSMFLHRFHMRVVSAIERVPNLDPITVQMHLKLQTDGQEPDDLGQVSIGIGLRAESGRSIPSPQTKFGIPEREVSGCDFHSTFPLFFRLLDGGCMLVLQENGFL
jgi:hypothetical protein